MILDALLHWLESSQLLRLFFIIALGYLLGDLRLPGNFRFGVAAVLFVGIAFGAWSPTLRLSEEIQSLGLVLFVYCIGLQAAAGFFSSLRRDGLALNAAMLLALLTVFGAFWLLARHGVLSPDLAAGLFCGSMTNTLALGAATEAAQHAGWAADSVDRIVLGYGVAYPLAIVSVLLLIQWRASRASPTEPTTAPETPTAMTIEVTRATQAGLVMAESGVILTRLRLLDNSIHLISPSTELPVGALVVAVGTKAKLRTALAALGLESDSRMHVDHDGYELKRFLVSNRALVGRRLGDLAVETHGGVVSRVRRGDVELPVSPETVLQLGDRVRVVTTRERQDELAKFFGDSLTMASEMGYLSFALGIVAGLAIGQIPFPLPGLENPVRLGAAGGALIAALILGRLGRTGPFIWQLTYGANLSLRQLGILLFLACVGTKAGGGLVTLLQDDGLMLLALSLAATVGAHALLLGLLWLFGRRTTPGMLGVMCGFQTQPAALSLAASRTEVGALNAAYATVYPLALIAKIVLVQLLLLA
ncbi:MAG: TrkA C-terminal domain-containing protein [Candidatus Didemnitutus sp.]|nr:TrkA C-terminal domain-containing protein [Candidatus Didemnitutus sp.]